MQEADVPAGKEPPERDRSNEQPRLTICLPKVEMEALKERAKSMCMTPQEVVLEALLRGVRPSPPASVCFPVLTTMRRRIEDLQRELDTVAQAALACLATNEDTGDVLLALGKLHVELVHIAAQLDQGVP